MIAYDAPRLERSYRSNATTCKATASPLFKFGNSNCLCNNRKRSIVSISTLIIFGDATMRQKSLLVTFDEALGVYLRDYSKRHRSYILCFRAPTLSLIALLRRLNAITTDDAKCYRAFVNAEIPIVVLVPLLTHSHVEEVTREVRWRRMTGMYLWHRGRLV